MEQLKYIPVIAAICGCWAAEASESAVRRATFDTSAPYSVTDTARRDSGKEYIPPKNPEFAENARELGAFVVKVTFEPGTDLLSRESREEIDLLIEKARDAGKLDKIRVLAWADREYPHDGEKVSRSEKKLADRRGDAVRDYLKEQLEIRDVDVYNMARRPSAFSKMLRTPETKIKTKAEELGLAPTGIDASSLFGERRRASSALVLAVMEE